MAAGDKAALAKAEDRFLEAALAQLQAELEPFARETTEDISAVLREAGLLQARHWKVRITQFEGEPLSCPYQACFQHFCAGLYALSCTSCHVAT